MGSEVFNALNKYTENREVLQSYFNDQKKARAL